MFNAFGVVIFSDRVSQKYFKEEIVIESHYECELDNNIDQDHYEEVTYQGSIILKLYNCKIRMQVAGVRNNEKDKEFLYTSTVDLFNNDTIYTISFLGNNECLHGYFYGY